MNNKGIGIITVTLISVCFQGCYFSNNKEAKMTRELGEKAYSYIGSSELYELFNDLVQKAIKGNDYDIDKYIYVRNLVHDESYRELFEVFDVRLLKGLGDEQFLRALKRQDRELQDNVCNSLMRDQWNVDGYEEEYNVAKARPEYKYPKTKKYVFELSKSWYTD